MLSELHADGRTDRRTEKILKTIVAIHSTGRNPSIKTDNSSFERVEEFKSSNIWEQL
jgi:hypothetical protein